MAWRGMDLCDLGAAQRRLYQPEPHNARPARAGLRAGVFRPHRMAAPHASGRRHILFDLLSWIFFRANSLADAWYVLTHLLPLDLGGVLASFGKWDLLTSFALLALFLAAEFFSRGDTAPARLFYRRRSVRYACYLLLFVLIMMFGVTGNEIAFIYFQF